MKNNKIIIFIGFCLLFFVSILAYLLSQYYFNELELKFRKDFFVAYNALADVEEGIAIRQQGVEQVGEVQFSEVGKKIESNLDIAVEYLEKSQVHNKQQQKIALLLPGKYKKYLELKRKSLDGYYELAIDFRERKQNEHITTETMMLIVQIDSSIYDFSNYEQWLDTMEYLEYNTTKIKLNAKQLLEADHINEELYEYITNTADGYMHLHDLYLEAFENEDWQGIDYSSLDNYFTPTAVAEDLLSTTYQRWADKNQAHFEKMEANDEEIVVANVHYNENKLGYDPLSIFLSFFNNAFPRIRIIDNQEPTILPADTDTYIVS